MIMRMMLTSPQTPPFFRALGCCLMAQLAFASLVYSGTLQLIPYPGNTDYSGIENSPQLQEALAASLYGTSAMARDGI